MLTDSLLDFMEAEHEEGPFFVHYPMILLHGPFRPTPGSESRQSRDRQRNFEDMVTHMDEIVGRFAAKAEDPTESDPLPPSANPEAHAELEAKLESMPPEGQVLLEYE